MIDVGSGPPVVLIPGIQGRWEWMRAAVVALARHCRVITFSLPGEPGEMEAEDRDSGFEIFLRQVDGVFDQARLPGAVLCGVSFGGLIALRYAARRPERVRALVLVSALGPGWRPKADIEYYMRAPRLRMPLFVAGAIRRGLLELDATYSKRGDRLRFILRFLWIFLRAPYSPTRMARRARLAAAEDFASDCRQIAVPTLVVTGEFGLDRVVPPETTLDYVTSIRGAKSAILKRTGHLGVVTRPEQLAGLVSAFVSGTGLEEAGAVIEADRGM